MQRCHAPAVAPPVEAPGINTETSTKSTEGEIVQFSFVVYGVFLRQTDTKRETQTRARTHTYTHTHTHTHTLEVE